MSTSIHSLLQSLRQSPLLSSKMASFSSFQFIAICCILLISASLAKTSQFKPKALFLQVSKDPKTNQYLTNIKQRTPLVSLSLTVDLGGKYLWTDCESGYVSSTYRYYNCHTPQCKSSRLDTICDTCDHPPGQGCHNDSCTHFSENSVMRYLAAGVLTSDVVSIQSTDGSNPTRVVSVPNYFFFCTKLYTFLLEGLANGVRGIAGLGSTQLSLPSQFARFFNYRKIFAICLSPSAYGVIFLGDRPYMLHPNVNVASSLTYTPLIVNRGRWIEQPSSDYYIGVKSIKINEQVVPINTTLLSFDELGNGGTKISTVNPYMLLEHTIYYPVIKAFVKAMPKIIPRVAPVPPFDVCYNWGSIIGSMRMGRAVPTIDLVLQSKEVYWRIFGANSMVQVSKDIMCLGIVKQRDISPWNAIVIGGHQLENNLLQFNLAKSRLGFSSSLFFRQTTCANFNFTSTA